MKFTERFLIILILIGIVLRFTSTEGGIFLQTLGSLGLALFYMFFSVFLANDINYSRIFTRLSYQDFTAGSVLKPVISGFIFAIAIFAILFTTADWTGARVLFVIGFVLTIALFATLLILFLSRAKQADKQLLIRASVLLGLLLLLKIIEFTLLRG